MLEPIMILTLIKRELISSIELVEKNIKKESDNKQYI